ncbi:hypothetical protein Tco_1489514, partial [Tanacetum coccineum]
MANLKYSDKHNMVAFLKKTNESVGFTKVVDFLKGTSLKYALTHNPTIYDSLVKQFWQTATVIQNQMIDYGFNFMNTKIHIDNKSTICVVKNPVYHSRTKHIEIRHHFIRDCYEKRLIDVLKIHTGSNVADLLTKRFDVTRHNMVAFLKKPNESVGFTE